MGFWCCAIAYCSSSHWTSNCLSARHPNTQTPNHYGTLRRHRRARSSSLSQAQLYAWLRWFHPARVQPDCNDVRQSCACSTHHASNNKVNPRKKLDPRETFTANDFYARLPDPRRKTNSKNRSNLDLGDPRAQTFETMNMSCFRTRELPNPRAPLVEGFEDMSMEERDRIYRRALERTTITGVRKLESDIRMKIDQRTSGGPFALRKAFKYFDRDGSGDIDPDEFFAAMDWFGLQFTEDAVLGLFGLYDDDRGGSLGYYEFVDNIISSDKDKQAAIAGTDRINAMLSGTGTEEIPSPFKAGIVDDGLARKCFDMCDRNGSGKIELTELEAMFKQFGVPTDSDVMNRAFVVLDKNFDGEISFEEFWEWWAAAMPRHTRAQRMLRD